MRARWWIFALLAATGCSSTPRVDLDAEEKAIRELSARWNEAEAAKEIDTILTMYANDALELPSNTPPVKGATAIRAWYESWLPSPDMDMSFQTEIVEVAASGDLAYERGTYSFTMNSPSGPLDDDGKYVTIWKKIDGQWKAFTDIANSNRPCRPEPEKSVSAPPRGE